MESTDLGSLFPFEPTYVELINILMQTAEIILPFFQLVEDAIWYIIHLAITGKGAFRLGGLQVMMAQHTLNPTAVVSNGPQSCSQN